MKNKTLEEQQAIYNAVKQAVEPFIKFDSLEYMHTKEFNNNGKSTFHTYGAKHKKLAPGQVQGVTYEEETGLIQISLHNIWETTLNYPNQ